MKKTIAGLVFTLIMSVSGVSFVLADETIEVVSTIPVSEEVQVIQEEDKNEEAAMDDGAGVETISSEASKSETGAAEKIIRGYLADDELVELIKVYNVNSDNISLNITDDVKKLIENKAVTDVNEYKEAASELKIFGIDNDSAKCLEYKLVNEKALVDNKGYKKIAVVVTIPFKYAGSVADDDELPVGIVDLSENVESEDGAGAGILSEDALLSYYDGRDYLPPLRSQGSYNTCWAHAMIAVVEANLIKKGLILNPDLSEGHFAYFHYNNVVDPLGGTVGDYTTPDNPSADIPWDALGNASVAQSILARWLGAASEEVAPYSKFAEGYDKSLAYEDVAHMENSYMANILTDRMAVKNLICNVGAVVVQAYMSDKYYNATNNSYNNITNNEGGSHLVAVVGWDDDFSAENFNYRPEGDGAWLIRNSWVVADKESDYYNSYYGYFWMSYYDESLRTSAIAIDVDMADKYNNNYQYDGGTNTFSISGMKELKCANVFTAKANAEGESLKAACFFSTEPNTEYKIEVYLNPTNADNPESGILIQEATTTGFVTYGGYHTAQLRKPVALKNGEKFAVVVTLSKDNDIVGIGAENPLNSWFKSEVSSRYGESFVDYGYGWSDAKEIKNPWTDQYYYNIRIKALTNNVYEGIRPTISISYKLNGGTNSSKNPTTYDRTSGSFILAKPTKAGCTFGGWYKDSGFTSKVTELNSKVKSNLTLYAKWNYINYTITYKLNGGKNSSKNPASYKITTADITLVKPSKTGYTFKGWYTDSKFTKKITVIKKGSTGNKTLYAKWTANNYTIKFNANGGKGTMKNKSMTYGKAAKLTKNAYKRKGYSFLGWNTDKKAKKAKYKNMAEVKNLTSKSGASVTLYAIWKKK